MFIRKNMAKQPLISIITINRDNFEGLKRTINSVLNQTWKHFEYILIDGDSKDGSAEYLKKRSSEVDYWVSEPDTGIYNAMNKGIKKASGDYLLFLNSGDELYSLRSLEKNYKFLTGEDIVYFDIFLVFEKETKIHNYPDELQFSTFRDGAIGHPTTFIKSSLFSKIGFYDESLRIVADWKFFLLAIVKFSSSYKKVNNVLSKFYMDGISSNNLKLVEEERNRVLQENFSDLLNKSKSKKSNRISMTKKLYYRIRSFILHS